MAVIEKTVIPVEEQDLFLGTNGIRPNLVTTISPEQAQCLQGECDGTPAPALQEAFEARKQNQAKSKVSK